MLAAQLQLPRLCWPRLRHRLSCETSLDIVAGDSSEIDGGHHGVDMGDTTGVTATLVHSAVIPEIQLPPDWDPETQQETGEDGGKGVKVRLVRSHAIRDSASPPPPAPGNMSEGGSERSTGESLNIEALSPKIITVLPIPL